MASPGGVSHEQNAYEQATPLEQRLHNHVLREEESAHDRYEAEEPSTGVYDPQVAAERSVPEGIPPDVIEYEHQIPLIAEDGMDRRNHVPPGIRRELHESLEREALEHEADTHEQPEYYGTHETRPANSENFLTWHEETPRTDARVNDARLDDGPSFLSIGDEKPSAEQETYLYQEPVSHARRNLALVIVAGLIVLGAVQWRSIRDYGMQYINNGTMAVKRGTKDTPKNPPAVAADNTSLDMGLPNTPVQQGKNAPAPVQSSPNADRPLPVQQTPPPAASTPSPNAQSASATPAQPSSPSAMSNPSVPPPSVAPATKSDAAKATPSQPQTPAADAAAANEKAQTKSADPRKDPKSARNSKQGHYAVEQSQALAAGTKEMLEAEHAKDPELRTAWLWRATAKGNPDAPVQLADMYSTGHGVPKNCDQAMVLLRSAASKGNARAQAKLAAMYSTGNCVKQDRVQAYHWITEAARRNPDSDWVRENQQMIWKQMSANERARVH